MKVCKRHTTTLSAFCLMAIVFAEATATVSVGERPAVETHMDQADIDAKRMKFKHIFNAGRDLFEARFNTLDGQGRPASTGDGAPRVPVQPAFIRTSAPDSNSCAGCHNQPSVGGAGDFVANVFVVAQTMDPVTTSVSGEFGNERNTLGMHGSGYIEMLAREMSAELIAIREAAAEAAAATGSAVTRELVVKGVSFGRITVMPDGKVDPSEIDGVDWDLIVKPFHQKGDVVSIREFTNNAMNHHHGMQSVERFGEGTDPDQDGVTNELSIGDITAATIFQAALFPPLQAQSRYPARSDASARGERIFSEIGCDTCHRKELVLDTRKFSEPNPYNPPGNLTPSDVSAPFEFDLPSKGKSNLIKPLPGGQLSVRAFTDLKRHDLNDADYDHFANEQVAQGSLVGFAKPEDFTVAPQPRPTRQFLTRKLWDVGNTNPYGHRGDLTTLTEAIYHHGGNARAQRDAYFGLPQSDRDAVIEFLKSLVIP